MTAQPDADDAIFTDSVAEVAGPPFNPTEAAAAIVLGVLALLISGLFSILFSTLAEEHRLSAAGIGLSAMIEALVTTVVTGAAGIMLKPVRLRTIAAVAAAALTALDLATTAASGTGVLAIRGLAGAPEGILLWIAIGFISRTATPERWAALLFTGMGLSQLAVATGVSAFVLPRFGANGGFVVVAVSAALAIPLAPFLPTRLGAPGGEELSGAPPPRGWLALAGTLAMAAPLTAVTLYLVPLAQQAGLSVAVGRTAVSVSLACQMLGGVVATAIAGRVRYIAVFWVCAAAFAAAWTTYAFHAPAWLFIGLTGVAGLAAYVAAPFLLPMTVEADPSRRATMQSGTVQLLAAAFGPLLAALVVNDKNVHGVLVLGFALQAVGLAIATGLHRTAHAERRRA
ncbi:hypothetical protein [Phenylobacterium sp.]|jgi:hypothetical protein|uniref:hypothetical protein n=1 Tax=Phenylobacterium sp. TaxID=1871053 RepID=UPI002F3E7A0C